MNIKDMVGKKVTCEIDGAEVDDARMQKEDRWYYICQNVRTGSIPSDTLGYKYGWCIYDGSDDELRDTCVTNLKLAKEPTAESKVEPTGREETWKPKRGDRVLVSTECDEWYERIYLGYIKGASAPIICVNPSEETKFNLGEVFSIAMYVRMEPLEEKEEKPVEPEPKKWARAAYLYAAPKSMIVPDELFNSRKEAVDYGNGDRDNAVKVIYPARFDEDGYLIEDVTVEDDKEE